MGHAYQSRIPVVCMPGIGPLGFEHIHFTVIWMLRYACWMVGVGSEEVSYCTGV